MSAANRWLILAIVSSALMLIVVDMTVLYTALPRLTYNLHASASEKLWIVNAYPLVVAGMLPGLGTLGDRLGHRSLFITGLIVFGLASLVAAYSPTSHILIVARILLAVGAAMMMPATLSIIRLTFDDPRERSLAIGVWASVASGGAAVGPVLGGILLEYFWWGSVFLINVPIVLIALIFTLSIVPSIPVHGRHSWDFLGSVQILIGIVGVAYAIKELSKRAPSYSSMTFVLLIGLLALVDFIQRQRRSASPLVDFSLFRDRQFSAGVGTALIASLAVVGVELVVTQRLQLVSGLSPLQAGLFIPPVSLASFVAGPLAGIALARCAMMTLAASALIAAFGLAGYLFLFTAGVVTQLACLSVFGFGAGALMAGASGAIMIGAPPDRAGVAAPIEEVSYELGGAIGIATLGSVMSAMYAVSLVLPSSLVVPDIAYDSLDEALIVAQGLTTESALKLRLLATAAFDRAFMLVIAVATALLFATSFALSTRATQRES